jgi:hypothetical protein
MGLPQRKVGKGVLDMALEQELAAYQRKLPELLASEGKFVLLRGEELAGIWDTYEDALQAGYSQFGLEPFMVKRIQGVEQALYFSRDLTTCPSSTPK